MPDPSSSVSRIESDLRCATLLAAIGGFVDAAGFLVLAGLFTAHMSGNTTGLATALASGDWGEALRRGSVIPVYLLATGVGAAWIEWRSSRGNTSASRDRAIAGVLVVELVMLGVFMLTAGFGGGPDRSALAPTGFFVTAVAATLAMGFQNAALRRLGATAVHTTFVTGMLTEFAVTLSQWFLHARGRRPQEASRAHRGAVIAGAVWGAYLTGGFSGAWLVLHHGIWVVAIPILALAAILVVLLRPRPSPQSSEATP